MKFRHMLAITTLCVSSAACQQPADYQNAEIQPDELNSAFEDPKDLTGINFAIWAPYGLPEASLPLNIGNTQGAIVRFIEKRGGSVSNGVQQDTNYLILAPPFEMLNLKVEEWTEREIFMAEREYGSERLQQYMIAERNFVYIIDRDELTRRLLSSSRTKPPGFSWRHEIATQHNARRTEREGGVSKRHICFPCNPPHPLRAPISVGCHY